MSAYMPVFNHPWQIVLKRRTLSTLLYIQRHVHHSCSHSHNVYDESDHVVCVNGVHRYEQMRTTIWLTGLKGNVNCQFDP